MKETLWLHIGPHKTGTTSIQHALNGYDDGVTRYADLGLPNHSLALVCAFRRNLTDNASLDRFGMEVAEAADLGDEVREALIEELATRGKTLILSGEAMCLFDSDDFGDLADFVGPQAKHVRVLAYAREPLGMLSSSVQQIIRSGALPPDGARFSYRDRLEPAMVTFGRENMQIRLFDTGRFHGGTLVRDFCFATGANPQGLDDRHERTGISREAIAMLHRWNATPEAAQGSVLRFRARTRLITVLSRHFPGAFRLAPDFARSLLPPGDLEWLRDAFGIDFTEVFQRTRPMPHDVASWEDLEIIPKTTVAKLAALARSHGVNCGEGQVEEIMTGLFQYILSKLEQAGRGT